MARVGACVTTHFLEPDRADWPGQPVDLGQPVGKAQIAHATTVEATGFEAGRAAGDQTVMAAQGPPGCCAEIKGEDAGSGNKPRLGAPVQRVNGIVHVEGSPGSWAFGFGHRMI